MNFKSQHQDHLCLLKCSVMHLDSQENLPICQKLSTGYSVNVVSHSDLYKNIWKQIEAVKVFNTLLKQRSKLITQEKKHINCNTFV